MGSASFEIDGSPLRHRKRAARTVWSAHGEPKGTGASIPMYQGHLKRFIHMAISSVWLVFEWRANDLRNAVALDAKESTILLRDSGQSVFFLYAIARSACTSGVGFGRKIEH